MTVQPVTLTLSWAEAEVVRDALRIAAEFSDLHAARSEGAVAEALKALAEVAGRIRYRLGEAERAAMALAARRSQAAWNGLYPRETK